MSKAWHRLKHYLRHDFREIVNPTSLPNPPDYVPPRKVTWSEFWKVCTDKDSMLSGCGIGMLVTRADVEIDSMVS